MPNETTFRKFIFCCSFSLALKRYACIVFAVGLFVFVFLFIYPKGGYQFVDALRTRTKFFGSGDHVFRVSERIELHIGKHLRRGG